MENDTATPVTEKKTELSFSAALFHLKEERKVARIGWNGKGMWLGLVKANEWQIDNHSLPLNPNTIDGNIQNLCPFIVMKTADDKFVPWLASQTDILAEDWCIVE